MARDDHQLKFRVPEGLKKRIETAARLNGRSLNAEIIQSLEGSYPDFGPAAQARFDRVFEVAKSVMDEKTRNELREAIEEYLNFMIITGPSGSFAIDPREIDQSTAVSADSPRRSPATRALTIEVAEHAREMEDTPKPAPSLLKPKRKLDL